MPPGEKCPVPCLALEGRPPASMMSLLSAQTGTLVCVFMSAGHLCASTSGPHLLCQESTAWTLRSLFKGTGAGGKEPFLGHLAGPAGYPRVSLALPHPPQLSQVPEGTAYPRVFFSVFRLQLHKAVELES